MEGLLGLIFIAFIYNLYLSYKRLELLYKNDFDFGYLIHVLMDFNVITSIIGIIIIIWGVKSVKKRNKQLKENYEENKRLEKELREKEINDAREAKEQNLRKIRTEKRKYETKIKLAIDKIGYLNDGITLENAFILIRKFGITKELFKPNDNLTSDQLDKKLEAVKVEEKINQAILNFNNFYDIEEDNKKLQEFLINDLESFLIKEAKRGIDFPYVIHPFYTPDPLNKFKSRLFSQYKHNLFNIFRDLTVIPSNASKRPILVDEPDFNLPIYKLYFDNKNFKKIKDDLQKKGLHIYWQDGSFTNKTSEYANFCFLMVKKTSN